GKVMASLRVYALPDRLLLELPPGLTQKTLLLLDKYLISEKASFEPMDEASAVVSVQGAQAPALLARLAGQPMDLAPHAHVEATLAGLPVRVVQRSEFGARPGFFIWAAPDAAPPLQAALEEVGVISVAPAVAEVLRVEAGEAAYGQDVGQAGVLTENELG